MYAYGYDGYGYGEPGGGSAPPAPVMVARNAVNILGPGHGTGVGTTTSNGTAANVGPTFVNRSGAAITDLSVVLSGWFLASTGTTAVGNSYPVTVNVEYPIGGATQSLLFGGSAAGTVPNNDDVVSDTLTLSTPIPANASFKINVATTTPNGQNYISTAFNLGLTGVRTHAMSNTLKKQMIYAVGDSIMTNNGSLPHATCNQASGCPSFQTSIGGTMAKTYAANSGAQFVRQIALGQKLGTTIFFSNFATNDANAGDTNVQIQTSITTLRNMAAAVGIGWTHATMLVRSSRATVTCSAVSFAGSTVTATVPDASRYVVGRIYTMSGASPANGYNATRRCIAVDTVLNTVSLESTTPTAPTATGTIQLNNPYLYDDPNFLVLSAGYNGAGSTRGLVNNWIRTSGLVDVCEWSDNCETARDSGFWKTGFDDPTTMHPPFNGTVTSIINATRFQSSGPQFVGSSGVAGVVVWTSGPNVGTSSGLNTSNGNGDITVSSAPASAIAIGHTFTTHVPVCRATADGVHPDGGVGNLGGQQLLRVPTSAWLAARLA
jgi:hypothetical protein